MQLRDAIQDLVQALDPVEFAKALGFSELDPWQIRALRWTGKRLIICAHRQAGKSTIAAILALHRALYWPRSLVLLVSPSLRQSVELYRKVRDLLARLSNPPALEEETKTSLTMANGSRIVSLPSTESTVRGFSAAALIVEDEAARVPDELHAAVRPMLAVSGGRLILISTPAGKRGHFWEVWANGGPEWERIMVKATECPRISPEFLAEERRALGSWWYAQEYECAFLDPESAAIPSDLVDRALDPGVKPLRLARSPWRAAVGGRA